LHAAADHADFQFAKILLGKGASPEFFDRMGRTLLRRWWKMTSNAWRTMEMCTQDMSLYNKLVDVLPRHGANVNAQLADIVKEE
jgi:hypothetical protein